MKILIITYGTRGDVQPYVALALGLKKQGHQVALATSERFRNFVHQHGIDFLPMDDGLLAIIDTDQGKKMIETTTNIFAVIRQNIRLSQQIKPMRTAQLYETWEIAQEYGPDYILYHPKSSTVPHIAEKLAIGCALITPIPMFVPTGEHPFLVLPELNLGGWYNRLSYAIISTLTKAFLGSMVKTFREDIGLPPVKKFDLLKTGDGKDIPVIHIHSEAVLPRPGDWPDSAFTTGYCLLKSDDSYTAPEPLAKFLAAGPPPVYIGFGSMSVRNPQQMTDAIVKALELAGVRGILATGWGGLTAKGLPEHVVAIDKIPHEWLFPQVAAVIHHGGAGTTAAGLLSGKPSIIVPFFVDQPFWARIVYRLGVGPRPIPRKKLSAQNLAEAITTALADTSIKIKAQRIGRILREEDGVAHAVKVIEELLQQSKR